MCVFLGKWNLSYLFAQVTGLNKETLPSIFCPSNSMAIHSLACLSASSETLLSTLDPVNLQASFGLYRSLFQLYSFLISPFPFLVYSESNVISLSVKL